MAHPNQQNFYSNPAFCQKSEYYPQSPQNTPRSPQRALSPVRNYPQRALSPNKIISPQFQTRHPPVGAQSSPIILDTSIHESNPKEDYEEQEFYEEMYVDDHTGVVQQKNFLVVSSDVQCSPKVVATTRNGARYQPVSQVDSRTRYEYVQVDKQAESTPQKVHRYACIPGDEPERLPVKSSGRYALVPLEDLKDKSRYETITQTEMQSGRYEFIKDDLPYEANEWHGTQSPPRAAPKAMTRSHSFVRSPDKKPTVQQRQGNPIATQKLHELLQTPRKTKQNMQQTPQKSDRSIIMSPTKQNLLTPSKQVRVYTPKAQQQLNYSIGTQRQNYNIRSDGKRTTAVVAPMCASPSQSVYSETTYSNKTESWMNLSMKRPPVQGALAAAAVMMILCGGVTTGLCFYMISMMGRLYFLDFGVISGFTCLLLGLMGFRTRNCYWLPNRNYISGYVVLSIFSLVTCAGLLVLLFMQPRPGTPLADITSGAVCAISVLSLVLASSGVIASYCCKYPPPDNRVEHCARGFTV